MTSLFLFLVLVSTFGYPSFSSSVANPNEIIHRKRGENDDFCPLNLDFLRKLIVRSGQGLSFHDVPTECNYMLHGIRLIRSVHLQSTGFFSPPSTSSAACWDSYRSFVLEFVPGFDVQSVCRFNHSLLSGDCLNITTRAQFESLLLDSELRKIHHSCNQSLENNSTCTSCKEELSSIDYKYFHGVEDGNVSDCSGYPFIYAAALVNRFGPTDSATTKCLFSLDFGSINRKSKKLSKAFWGVLTGSFNGFLVGILLVLLLWMRHRKRRKRKRLALAQIETGSGFESEMINGTANTSLMRFTFEEIRRATGNFSRENIIGKGGYGNVYKGVLADGSEVALKRFKNCSAAGDAVFAHEVEVIASVRHVNLVALRGYCTSTVPLEGHHRIIVCELMQNGSLSDHLFGTGKKLSWPIRQKIAIGTARGLAYLHYGAQPSIIHRDVKPSNIVLDETFEPKLADFGLAKFTPEGLSHLSTKVAGTLGYVAPEYALYGQLTERSDVYSFGVVLLELLSGKKAVISFDDNKTSLLTDWAWSLVKEGRALDVIDESMPELGLPEVMERYVLVAVLSSHPQLYARPTMDQIVKILETDSLIPSIPDRPLSLLAEINKIEQSAGSSGSNHISSPS